MYCKIAVETKGKTSTLSLKSALNFYGLSPTEHFAPILASKNCREHYIYNLFTHTSEMPVLSIAVPYVDDAPARAPLHSIVVPSRLSRAPVHSIDCERARALNRPGGGNDDSLPALNTCYSTTHLRERPCTRSLCRLDLPPGGGDATSSINHP